MKELKTVRDVVQAILDGYEVEYWNEPLDAWFPLEYFQGYSKSLDKKITPSKHRIKPSKPSIDWSHVSEKYNYLARDEDGKVYLYENNPKISYYDCWKVTDGDFTNASIFKSLDAGNCHWTESLVTRPKEQ